MDIRDFNEIVIEGKYDLDKKESFLRSLMLPAITIKQATVFDEKGISTYGGNPLVPDNFEWPKHEFGDYRFIAQFHLSEIPSGENQLPKKGLLSIFVAYDDENTMAWTDDNYAKVFYFENVADLKPYDNPNFPDKYALDVIFKQEVDIPFKPELYPAKGLNKKQMNYVCTKVLEQTDKRYDSYLLGYPYYNSLNTDPRENDKWTSLLTLRYQSGFGLYWNDRGYLMLFIEKEKLAKGDFSNIKSNAG
ncbi:YwqG family protein [Maribacter sp.]|uniref:YwqG family protein n=1 Tax=Maribacter sp. TaxID=1897614 RepID=UPI003297EEB5